MVSKETDRADESDGVSPMVIELPPRNGRLEPNDDLDSIVLSIIDREEFDEIRSVITSDKFEEWYRERRYAENIKEGQPYFNGPGRVTSVDRQSPSQLLQCKRKTVYKQLKAPEETSDPHGIFWFGEQIEDELVFPFLEDAAGEHYVTNSIWVNYTVSTDAGEVTIKGSTDPVIVDEDSEPILLTEIKSKESVDHLERPNEHHFAQAMAYLIGLSENNEQDVNQAVIIYIGKSDLSLKPFFLSLDEDFWEDRVIPWISDVKAYRLEQELPPATPEQEWECNFCPYKERCGNGERDFENIPPGGLLPLFSYPRESLTDYLELHTDAKLTPSTAHKFPELAARFDVANWQCRGCKSEFNWDRIKGTPLSPPRCPKCELSGNIRILSGPMPVRQMGSDGWPQ